MPLLEARQAPSAPDATAFVAPAVALMLVLACAAIFQTDLHMYDTARFMELGLLAVALPCLVLSRRALSEAIDPIPRRSAVWGLTVIAVACLSCALAARTSAAIHDLALNIALALLGLAICSAVRHEGKGGVTDTLLACMFPLVAFSILVRFAYELTTAHVLGEAFEWTSPFLSFANVRFFSQVQAYSLWLMVLPLMLPVVPRRLHWFFFLVAAGFWMLLVLVPSRSVWLALTLSAAFAWAFFPRDAVGKWLRPSLFALLAGIAAAYLLMASLAAGAPGPREVMEHAGRVADRVGLWTGAASLIVAYPLLGVGPANFAFFHDSSFGHPHDLPLQVAAEYGLPVALLLLVAGWGFYARGVRALRTEPNDTLNSALLAAIACGLIDAMFSGNNLMPHSQIVIAVLVGWILGRMGHSGRRPAESASASTAIIKGAAAVIWCVLAWAAYDYGRFARSDDYVLTTAGPRFWFDSRSVYYAP